MPDDADILSSRAAGPAALRGGAMRAAGYAAGIGLSLISAPILIRHLGVDGFGRYTTVMALVGLVGGITEAGVNTIALREFAAREGEDRDDAMRQLIGIRLATTIAGLTGAVIFAVLAGYAGVLVLGTIVAGAGLLLANLQSLLAVALQAQMRFGWATSIELIRQAVTVALVVALAAAGAGLLPFFAVAVVGGVLALMLTFPKVRGLTPMRPAFNLGAWRALLRATVPWAIAAALSTAYFRVAIILMSLVGSVRQTGYFATSFRVMEVLTIVPGIAITAALPILARAARDDSERFDAAARRIIELSVIGGCTLALGVLLGAPIMVAVLAGHSGAPATPVLRIQGLALLPVFLAGAGGLQLLSLGRVWAVVAGNFAGLLVAGGMTVVLASSYEAQGAATATALAEVVVASTVMWALARARPQVGRGLRTASPALIVDALAACVLLIPGLPAIGDLVLGVTVYLAGLVAIGRFPPEVREALALGSRR